jgi:Zn-finger nucleic acid-binding protein
MARKCPQCQTTMKIQLVDGVELDVCPNCGGIWFNDEELRTMLKASANAIQDLERVVPHLVQKPMGMSMMLCPDHQLRLDMFHYMYTSPAVLHPCPKCGGFFIAAEELPKLEQAQAHAHDPSRIGEGALDAETALAEFSAEHEATMARHRTFQALVRTLTLHSPGWFI